MKQICVPKSLEILDARALVVINIDIPWSILAPSEEKRFPKV